MRYHFEFDLDEHQADLLLNTITGAESLARLTAMALADQGQPIWAEANYRDAQVMHELFEKVLAGRIRVK